MYSCILCKEEKRFGHRFFYGFVCKDCLKTLPNLFSFRKLSDNQITWLYENRKEKQFKETSVLGNLSIDEKNALFCIKKDFKKNYFSFLDCSEVGIEPTNAKMDDTGRNVYCDVEFQFRLRETGLYYKAVIKRREKCNVSPIMYDGKVQAREPLTVGLMRSMINQSIENQFSNAKLLLNALSEAEARKEEYLAQGTLMLPDGYTKEDLKRHRNSLIKAFHPDNNPDSEAGLYTDKINKAYQILKNK